MANILDRILAVKREEVAAGMRDVGLDSVRQRARDAAPPRDFLGAILARHAAGRNAVIAEIKRASPSQGVMQASLDPASVARSYESAGAACLSVLTDRQFFQGSAADLQSAKAACNLPVLRKDFMVDPFQVWEARALGADCILLIAGAVPLSAMQEMEVLAMELGMAVLVESHQDHELDEALQLKTPLVGINNRDLTSFKTDLGTSERLSRRVPADRIVVAESGIGQPEDVARLRQAGIRTFLVGGAFMSAPDPAQEFKRIFG